MTKPTLDATFQPQAWIGDDALDSGPAQAFDAADAVLSLTARELVRLDGEMRRASGRDLDVLAERAGLAGLGGENGSHDGPFLVDVDEGDWDRFLSELGLDPQAATDAEVAAARERSASAPTPR